MVPDLITADIPDRAQKKSTIDRKEATKIPVGG